MMANAGSTKPGEPYEMKYTDLFGNHCTHKVEHLDVLSKFFKDSSKLDTHNHAHQDCLGLEKDWVAHDCYFSLLTTLIGINDVDTWKLAEYYSIINWSGNNSISVQYFSGILGKQLIAVTPLIIVILHLLLLLFHRIMGVLLYLPLLIPKNLSLLFLLTKRKWSFQSEHRSTAMEASTTKTPIQSPSRSQAVVAPREKACLPFAFCCEEVNDCFLDHVSEVKLGRPSHRNAV